MRNARSTGEPTDVASDDASTTAWLQNDPTSRRSRRAVLMMTGAALSGTAGCLTESEPTVPDDDAGPDPVVAWNQALLDMARNLQETPTTLVRMISLMTVTMADATTTITAARGDEHYTPYGSYDIEVAANASRPAAVGGAAHEVLSTQYPGFTSFFDTVLSETLNGAEEFSGDLSAGEAWGRTVGQELLNERQDDGHDEQEAAGYEACAEPAETPGCWRGGAAGTWRDSHYAFLATWTLPEPVSFPGPPPLESQTYADDWSEVYELGEDTDDRPQEHVDIATFWRGGAGTARPSGRWIRIANLAALEFDPSLLETTRLMGLLGLGLCDAGISVWRSKHTHGYWRPVEAIRNADTDGNAATVADTEWQPLAVGTSPEYPSALACYGSAGATILADFFGTDSFAFELQSSGPPEQTRSFGSFSEALEESWQSRIYVGNHFRFSLVDALEPGKEIAEYVLSEQFQPR